MSCCICMVQWQSVWMCIRYMAVDGNIFHLDQFVWMHDRIDCYIHECCISYCIYIGDWHVHLASISDFMLIPRLDKHDTYMEGLTKYLNLNLSAWSTIGWSYDEWSNKEICPMSALSPGDYLVRCQRYAEGLRWSANHLHPLSAMCLQMYAQRLPSVYLICIFRLWGSHFADPADNSIADRL